MSIIMKSQKEIQIMTGGLLYHIDRFRDVLASSFVYNDAKSSAGESENFDGQFICWLMFRMWVANKVAWIIQYGGQVNLREDLPNVTPYRIDLSELAAELRNLNYNIYTNGGQHWLDHDWHQLFKQIYERVKTESETAYREAV